MGIQLSLKKIKESFSNFDIPSIDIFMFVETVSTAKDITLSIDDPVTAFNEVRKVQVALNSTVDAVESLLEIVNPALDATVVVESLPVVDPPATMESALSMFA